MRLSMVSTCQVKEKFVCFLGHRTAVIRRVRNPADAPPYSKRGEVDPGTRTAALDEDSKAAPSCRGGGLLMY